MFLHVNSFESDIGQFVHLLDECRES